MDKLIHQRLKVGDESPTLSTLSLRGVVCAAILKIERGKPLSGKRDTIHAEAGGGDGGGEGRHTH